MDRDSIPVLHRGVSPKPESRHCRTPLFLWTGLVWVLLALMACASDEGKTGLRSGSRAPDFAARDLQGRTWTLEQVGGKVVLLRFWADWCPYCRYEMPVIEKLYRRLKPAGFEVLAVNVGQGAEVSEAFGAQMNLTFPLLLDPSGEIAKRYRITGIPTNFLIDRQGILRGKLIGEAFREEKPLQKFLRDQFPEALLK